jgi:hypothetical protein
MGTSGQWGLSLVGPDLGHHLIAGGSNHVAPPGG